MPKISGNNPIIIPLESKIFRMNRPIKISEAPKNKKIFRLRPDVI
jgi:hypothetical protein